MYNLWKIGKRNGVVADYFLARTKLQTSPSGRLIEVGGTGNTFLGYNANVNQAGWNNAMALGYNATQKENNSIVLGNSSNQYLRCQVQTISPLIGSDRRIKTNIKENVPGLSFLSLLKPVTYHVDIHKENSIQGYPALRDTAGNVIGIDTVFWKSKYDIEKTQITGLIAQAVDSSAEQIGYDFNGIYKPKNVNNDTWALGYDALIVPLIKSIQELSKKADSLKVVVKSVNKLNNNATGATGSVLQIELANKNQVLLFQNIPNPSNGSFTIPYFIPENNNGYAFMVFNDIYGKELKKIEIKERGNGKMEMNSSNLASGIYTYSIVINNNIIDTKKMMNK